MTDSVTGIVLGSLALALGIALLGLLSLRLRGASIVDLAPWIRGRCAGGFLARQHVLPLAAQAA